MESESFSSSLRDLPMVSALVGEVMRALRGRFLLAEMFWEERQCHCFSSVPCQPRQQVERERGVHLRGMGQAETALSWTTQCDGDGIKGALARLGVTAPKLPPWPKVEASLGHAFDPHPWQEAFLAFLPEVQDLGSCARAWLKHERRLRGSAAETGNGRQWRETRVIVGVEATASDGRMVFRSRRLQGQCPGSLALCGVLPDVRGALLRRASQGQPVSGQLPVVLAPGAGALLFHELVGHSLEADNVLAGASLFSELEFGALVSSADLTVIDSPDPAMGPGGVQIDDEGQVPRPVELICAGALSGMLLDRATAAMTDQEPTGNGRRQGYRSSPRPRMRNLVVAAGRDAPEAVLGDIADGLYVERLCEAISDPRSRQFRVEVAEARRIRSGRLAEPLCDLVLRGDIGCVLSKVVAVACDLTVHPEPWSCIKSHDVVETGLASPTIRLAPLEIGA